MNESQPANASTLSARQLIPLLFFLLAWLLFSLAIHWILTNNAFGIDFFVYWQSGRSFFIDHLSPYSQPVVDHIQQVIYGRLANPSEDQFALAYPLYALFVTYPLYFLSYDWAQAVWLSFNLLVLVSSVALSFPKSPRWLIFAVLLIYPFTFGLIMGTFAVFLAVLTLTCYSVFANHNQVSLSTQIIFGFLLAWSTSKPQFTWLFVIFFLFINLRDRRWGFLASFIASLLSMLLISFAILPTWLSEFIQRVIAYSQYNQTYPTLTHFFMAAIPVRLALPVSAVTLAILFTLTGVFFFRWWRQNLPTFTLFAWCGFITYLVHPHSSPYEQLVFIIPLVVWAAFEKHRRWLTAGVWAFSILAYWFLFIWTRLPNTPTTAKDWPLIFYLLWVIWVLRKYP